MYDRYRVHVWKVNTWRSLRNKTILKIFPHSSKTLLSFCCTMWKIFTSHSVQLAHTKMFYYLLYFLYWYAEYCIYLALSHMLHLVYVEAKNLKLRARTNSGGKRYVSTVILGGAVTSTFFCIVHTMMICGCQQNHEIFWCAYDLKTGMAVQFGCVEMC